MATITLTIHFISKVCSINSGKLINFLSLIEKRQRISAAQLLSTVRANGIFIQDESRISWVLLRLSLLFHWAEEWATNQTLFSFISECDKLSTSFSLSLYRSLFHYLLRFPFLGSFLLTSTTSGGRQLQKSSVCSWHSKQYFMEQYVACGLYYIARLQSIHSPSQE